MTVSTKFEVDMTIRCLFIALLLLKPVTDGRHLSANKCRTTNVGTFDMVGNICRPTKMADSAADDAAAAMMVLHCIRKLGSGEEIGQRGFVRGYLKGIDNAFWPTD